jgi:hypothetical protein
MMATPRPQPKAVQLPSMLVAARGVGLNGIDTCGISDVGAGAEAGCDMHLDNNATVSDSTFIVFEYCTSQFAANWRVGSTSRRSISMGTRAVVTDGLPVS